MLMVNMARFSNIRQTLRKLTHHVQFGETLKVCVRLLNSGYKQRSFLLSLSNEHQPSYYYTDNDNVYHQNLLLEQQF